MLDNAVFGDFKVVAELGRGSFGTVYKARWKGSIEQLYRRGALGTGGNNPLNDANNANGVQILDEFGNPVNNSAHNGGGGGANNGNPVNDNLFQAGLGPHANNGEGEYVVLKRIDFRPWHQEKHRMTARKEVQILSKVKHPNIIRYFGSFTHKSSVFIIMEFANSNDLHYFVQKRQKRGQTVSVFLWFFWIF